MRTKIRNRKSHIANMLALIEEVGKRDMMRLEDAQQFLVMSESGARKYLRELEADQVLRIVAYDPRERTRYGIPIYSLSNDAALVATYVETLNATPKTIYERRARTDHTGSPRRRILDVEPGRQIHTLPDDVEHKQRLSRFRIPPMDPLLAALFGLEPAAA